MEVDWDLQAVVRGCRFTSVDPPPCILPINQVSDSASSLDFCLNNNFTPNDVVSPTSPPPLPQEELTDFILPFLHAPPLVTPVEPPLKRPSTTTSPTPRSKRRKNQFKKVCEVPAERLASDDSWSWRKYGQKPIKGSPHPRGYYRCSSSKGCPARKQVERNKSDSSMFIVTYTAEHNHPAPTHRHHNHQKLGPKRSNSSSSTPTSPSDNDEDHQSVFKLENCLDDIVFDEATEDGCMNGNVEDDFFDGLDEIGEGRVNTAQLPYSSMINASCIW